MIKTTQASGSTAPSPTAPANQCQGKPISAKGGGNASAAAARSGTIDIAPSGASHLEKRIEELTKQVAILAATNLKQLDLIAELTRQRHPAAQRPGVPAAQQQAQAQRHGGPAAQLQRAPAQQVVAPLQATSQRQLKAVNAAVHLAVQQGQDFVSLAGPAHSTYAAALARRSAPGAKGRRVVAAVPLAQALQPTATQLA